MCHVLSPTSGQTREWILPPWIDNGAFQLEGVWLEQRGVITHHPAAPGFPGSRTGLGVLLLLSLLVPICQDFCNSAAPGMESGCSRGVSACTACPVWGWRTRSIPREPRGGSCAQRRESQTLNRSSCTESGFVSVPRAHWGCLCVPPGDGAPHGRAAAPVVGRAHPANRPARGVLPTPPTPNPTAPPLPNRGGSRSAPLRFAALPCTEGGSAPPVLPAQPPVCSTAHSAPRGAFGSGPGRQEPQLIQGSIHTDCPRRQPAPCCGSPISSP